MTKKNDDFNFENAIARISEISTQVESDEIGLENAVKLYKEAAALRVKCQDFLKKTQTTIEEVNRKMDEIE